MSSRSYGRFYVLLSRFTGVDKDELKALLVRQYTGGRTESVREMEYREYDTMCEAMERMMGNFGAEETYREELRRRRSMVLTLMQRRGINTTDWNRVDAFCMDPRIAGKKFRYLTMEELETVAIKLRVIRRKEREKNTDYSRLN